MTSQTNEKILIVLTSAGHLTLTDGTEHPSGYWAEEFAVPYALLKEAGFGIDIATLGGKTPPVDASSLDPNMLQWVRPQGADVDDAKAAARYRAIIDDASELARPLDVNALSADDLNRYAGVYISGGHGCMEDMPSAPGITRLLLFVLQRGMPLASVCHGPTAFLAPRDEKGENPFSGKKVTCFSYQEETFTPINGRLPLVLEFELKKQGMSYSRAEAPWDSHVVVDGKLVTGQNPYSSAAVGRAFLEVLQQTRAQAA